MLGMLEQCQYLFLCYNYATNRNNKNNSKAIWNNMKLITNRDKKITDKNINLDYD